MARNDPAGEHTDSNEHHPRSGSRMSQTFGEHEQEVGRRAAQEQDRDQDAAIAEFEADRTNQQRGGPTSEDERIFAGVEAEAADELDRQAFAEEWRFDSDGHMHSVEPHPIDGDGWMSETFSDVAEEGRRAIQEQDGDLDAAIAEFEADRTNQPRSGPASEDERIFAEVAADGMMASRIRLAHRDDGYDADTEGSGPERRNLDRRRDRDRGHGR